MNQATKEESFQYMLNPHGGFLGNISFVDESYSDFKDLKDEYNLDAEVNLFCIVHKIDFIFDHEENLEEKLDNLLGEFSDSYLIPSEYKGVIVWDLLLDNEENLPYLDDENDAWASHGTF
jgi:hypothetical protein